MPETKTKRKRRRKKPKWRRAKPPGKSYNMTLELTADEHAALAFHFGEDPADLTDDAAAAWALSLLQATLDDMVYEHTQAKERGEVQPDG